MRNRKIMSGRKDKRYFARTAKRTNYKNIPGKMVERGGTRL